MSLIFSPLNSYWIDFSKWETFVNDDLSRTFLSMEIIAGGLMEVRQIWWIPISIFFAFFWRKSIFLHSQFFDQSYGSIHFC